MRIPVLWREGRWMLQYDAPIQFREGTVGELRVDHVESTDRDYLAAADERYKIAFLAEDVELRIALTIKTDLDEDLMPLLLEYSDTPHNTMAPISCQSRFVSVRLRPETAPTLLPDEGSGGLCFVFRGDGSRQSAVRPRGVAECSWLAGRVQSESSHYPIVGGF